MATTDGTLRQRITPQNKRRPLWVALALLAGSIGFLFASTDGIEEAWLWVGLGCAAFTSLFLAPRYLMRRWARRSVLRLKPLLESEDHPRILISATGKVLLRNAIADEQGFVSDYLQDDLTTQISADHAILERLLEAAKFEGAASEFVVGRHAKISVDVVHVPKIGFLCTFRSNPAGKRGNVPNLPMLTAAENGTVLFMNQAAREFLGARRTQLSDILNNDASMSDLNIVQTEAGPKPCFLMENGLSGDRREIFLIPALGKRALSSSLSYEEMPVAVLKIDKTGNILAANRTARDMIGPEAGEKNHLSEVMEGLGRPLADWLEEAAQGRAQNLVEFLRIKRDDRERFVQVTLGRAFDDGEPGLYAVFHDATELKTLEIQFVQSQKMQAIGQLAGGIAHDFNNLLTAMSGHCDLLLLRHDKGDPSYEDLLQIHQNANRAASLVKQLLAFSRKQTLQPATIDLKETMDDLTLLLKRLVADEVTLSVQHGDKIAPVYLDAQQFEQVIMNLVVNARDAMPNGGDVIIKTSNVKLRQPQVRARATVPAGDYVRVEVIDQGTGIDAARTEKVFEPFYTTKSTGEGTGLGLSTAYGIVKQSGGFIFVDSTVGQGTTFTLLFPKAEHKAPVFTHNAKVISKDCASSGTILLVEDEAPVRAFASRALRLKGFSVLEAGCGEEALEILEDGDLKIDLFLTDVAMPGLDGPTWVRKARKKRNSQVVFISGYAEEKFADQSASIPNATFLAKPFSLEELTATVSRQLATASTDAVV